MHRSRATFLLVGMLTAVLVTPGPAAAATERVQIHDYHYEPDRVRIGPGDRVEWKNAGDEAHTVTSDDPDAEDFDSDELGNGDEYRHTFDEAGTYRYHCDIHDNMTGVVEVVDPATTTTSTSSTTTSTSTPTTTAPPTTTPPTTTGPPPTTSSSTPAPPPRPPASVPNPPPETAAETAPPTTSTSTSTTTTTTEPAPTTVPPPPPEAAGPLGPEVPPTTPPADEGEERIERQEAAARSEDSDGGGIDSATSPLLAVLLASGLFGGWTLWKLRRVRT